MNTLSNPPKPSAQRFTSEGEYILSHDHYGFYGYLVRFTEYQKDIHRFAKRFGLTVEQVLSLQDAGALNPTGFIEDFDFRKDYQMILKGE